MPNLALQILGALSNLQGTSAYSTTSTSTIVNSLADATMETADFATVMNRLNNNVNNASSSYQNLLGGSSQSLSNNLQSSISPNISAILKEVNKNKNSVLGIEGQIKEYLLKHYGGSEAAVIRNLAGVQTLPAGVLSIQSAVFSQIVSKLSIKVRESMYMSYSPISSSETESSSTQSSEISSSDDDYSWIYW